MTVSHWRLFISHRWRFIPRSRWFIRLMINYRLSSPSLQDAKSPFSIDKERDAWGGIQWCYSRRAVTRQMPSSGHPWGHEKANLSPMLDAIFAKDQDDVTGNGKGSAASKSEEQNVDNCWKVTQSCKSGLQLAHSTVPRCDWRKRLDRKIETDCMWARSPIRNQNGQFWGKISNSFLTHCVL